MPSMIKVALDDLLARRGKSAYWLAKQAGLHQSVVSKLRHNEMIALRLDVLDRICDALGCEPGELLVRQAGSKAVGKTKAKGRKVVALSQGRPTPS